MLKTQYAQSGQRTETKLEKRGKWLKISSGKEGRVGEWTGLQEAASCHTGEKGQSENGFQQDLCSSAMWTEEEQCGNVGWLVFQDSSPGSALPLRFHTLHPPKKKAQFNSTPSSPQIAFRYTSLLQGPHMSP